MSGKSPRELAKQFEAPAPVEPARPSSVSPRAVAAAKVKKEIAAGQKADMPNVPKKRVKDKQWEATNTGGGGLSGRDGAYKKNDNPKSKVVYAGLPEKKSLTDLP